MDPAIDSWEFQSTIDPLADDPIDVGREAEGVPFLRTLDRVAAAVVSSGDRTPNGKLLLNRSAFVTSFQVYTHYRLVGVPWAGPSLLKDLVVFKTIPDKGAGLGSRKITLKLPVPVPSALPQRRNASIRAVLPATFESYLENDVHTRHMNFAYSISRSVAQDGGGLSRLATLGDVDRALEADTAAFLGLPRSHPVRKTFVVSDRVSAKARAELDMTVGGGTGRCRVPVAVELNAVARRKLSKMELSVRVVRTAVPDCVALAVALDGLRALFAEFHRSSLAA
jgi:hypothetical protein